MPTIDLTLAQRYDFVVRQNQTFSPTLTFTNLDGTPLVVTGAIFRLSVRRKNHCADDCGCEYDTGYNQVYKQDFVPLFVGVDGNQITFADTIDLAAGHYAYDLLVTWPNDVHQYFLKGNFKVEKSYTYASN